MPRTDLPFWRARSQDELETATPPLIVLANVGPHKSGFYDEVLEDWVYFDDWRWAVPLRPGENPREWATRQGFPVDVIEALVRYFKSDPNIELWATPMTPGESVREWAERVGYSPLKVDKIVAEWQNKM